MNRKNWVTLTIRMPQELHEIIKFMSRTLRMSINQLMIETLVDNIDMWRVIQHPEGMEEPFVREDMDEIDRVLEITKKKIIESGISDSAPDIETLRQIQENDEES